MMTTIPYLHVMSGSKMAPQAVHDHELSRSVRCRMTKGRRRDNGCQLHDDT